MNVALKAIRRYSLATAASAAALGMGGWLTGSAEAASIYESGGFEAPRFVADAPLEGQDPGPGPWVRSGGTAGSAVVQTTVVQNGQQAVRMDRAGQDVFWAVVEATPLGNDVVSVEWGLNVTPATHAGDFGPFFGVQVYDALDNAPLLAGAGGIDAKTGEILYQQAGTGALVAGPVVSFNAWHDFQLLLDYGTDTYSLIVDDATVVTGEPFVDDGTLGEINDFSDAPLVGLAAGPSPDEQGAAGTAYFDNYRVVPEPGSVALLGLAGVGLLARRRSGCRA